MIGRSGDRMNEKQMRRTLIFVHPIARSPDQPMLLFTRSPDHPITGQGFLPALARRTTRKGPKSPCA